MRIHQATVRGTRKWVVSHVHDGKRLRTFHRTKKAAEATAGRLREEKADSGAAWMDVPTQERQRLVLAWRKAKERGLDLYELATGAATTKVVAMPLAKAIEELLAAKETAGRSEDYIAGLRINLGQFAKGRGGETVNAVSLADVEAFLDSKAAASRATLRSRLSTLFRFAVRRGWRMDNPCDRLEVVTLPHRPPAVLTVEQTETALKWLRQSAPHALPWFILSTFAGLRPEEAEKTRREDIHEKEGWIKVEAQTSKVRQRRVVYPLPCVMRALAGSLEAGQLPIPSSTRRYALRRLRKELNLKAWPKDLTRHTGASYWLAQCQSAAQVAESLGHSEMVLRRNYKALVTTEEAKRFFGLCGEGLVAEPAPPKRLHRRKPTASRRTSDRVRNSSPAV
jgi:integrase